MKGSYFTLSLRGVKKEQEELVSELCFEHGAEGISEELAFRQEKGSYEPETINKKVTNLQVYFLSEPSEKWIQEMKKLFPEISLKVSRYKNKDWLQEWKQGLKAFCLCDPYWLVPTWLEVPAEAKEVLRVDPGMAFGTGTHETTQLASKLLVQNKNNLGQRVLDVGTGTGILAILVKKLGVPTVFSTEIDKDARAVAQKNFQINHVEVKVFDENLQRFQQSFDCVVANIIDGVLVNLQQDLKRLVKAGGILILTGILIERKAEFMSRFHVLSEFEVLETIKGNEWLGLALKKRVGRA